jgi:hypothetical protein
MMTDNDNLRKYVKDLQTELDKAGTEKRKLYVLKRLQKAHDELNLLDPATLRTADAEEYHSFLYDTVHSLSEIIGNIITAPIAKKDSTIGYT